MTDSVTIRFQCFFFFFTQWKWEGIETAIIPSISFCVPLKKEHFEYFEHENEYNFFYTTILICREISKL